MPPKSGNKSNRKLPALPKTQQEENANANTQQNAEKPQQTPEIPQDPDAWLKTIPRFIREDEELHKKLSAERRERSLKKHQEICQVELEAMFNYAFELDDMKHDQTRPFDKTKRIFEERWCKGEFIPPPQEEIIENEYTTELMPTHSLEISNYLHISSESIFADLADFYGMPYDENVITDPNPDLNRQLEILQRNMQPFLQPYKTPHIPFPYNICVVGPQYSGKTTVCMMLEKALDVHIIHVIGANIELNKKKKKGKED